MPSKKPTIAVRTEQDIIEKFKVICDKNKRSMSAELELYVINRIEEYESKYRKIKL